MVSGRLEIRNPTGLHIRPAAEFVRLARTFGCAVCVHKGDRSADAKNLITEESPANETEGQKSPGNQAGLLNSCLIGPTFLSKLLRIGIAPGDVIEMTCDGADEVEALASLTQFLRSLGD